ncbi:MAG: hypothetical protein CM15mP79_2050 [Methanobacteriota archaeon]|nr:MAG: hypothetical protein CM15mP79_2050 [Euryarchaeota archaeon]
MPPSTRADLTDVAATVTAQGDGVWTVETMNKDTQTITITVGTVTASADIMVEPTLGGFYAANSPVSYIGSALGAIVLVTLLGLILRVLRSGSDDYDDDDYDDDDDDDAPSPAARPPAEGCCTRAKRSRTGSRTAPGRPDRLLRRQTVPELEQGKKRRRSKTQPNPITALTKTARNGMRIKLGRWYRMGGRLAGMDRLKRGSF